MIPPSEQIKLIRTMKPGEAWVFQHGKYKCFYRRNKGSHCYFRQAIYLENSDGIYIYSTTHMPDGNLGVACFDIRNPVEVGVGHKNTPVGEGAQKWL